MNTPYSPTRPFFPAPPEWMGRLLQIDPGVSLGAQAMQKVETLVAGRHHVEIRLGDEFKGPWCTVRELDGRFISSGNAFEEKDGLRETVLDEAVDFAYSSWHQQPAGRS